MKSEERVKKKKHSCRKTEQQRQPDDIICAGEDGRAGGRGLMQSRWMNAASPLGPLPGNTRGLGSAALLPQ